MGHTPGPWKANKTKSCLIDSIPANRIIAETRGETLEEKRANVEFIVRACNCHDELLEACKAAAGRLRLDEKCASLYTKLTDAIAKVKNQPPDLTAGEFNRGE